jgi:hypothetical protein
VQYGYVACYEYCIVQATVSLIKDELRMRQGKEPSGKGFDATTRLEIREYAMQVTGIVRIILVCVGQAYAL